MTTDFYYGWEHPASAERYEEFCRAHSRYHQANQVLVNALAPGLDDTVLDFGAGTGNTTAALLRRLGKNGRVVCVEPAEAMRKLGESHLKDPRVSWRAQLPGVPARFDSVVCGAALWQVEDLTELLREFEPRLHAGCPVVFTMPSLYLGIPDRPGGGSDPQLTGLFERLAAGRPRRTGQVPLLSVERLEALLTAAGFTVSFQYFEHQLSQVELYDWLRIPLLTNVLLEGLELAERDRRLAAAFTEVDPRSYRWEGWVCGTARVVNGDADGVSSASLEQAARSEVLSKSRASDPSPAGGV